MVDIRVLSPKQCSSETLDAFCELVRAGGEVQPAGLSARVERAAFLAFAHEPEGLVGVAALKNPYQDYRAGVFKKAGSARAEDYPYELGWVYVVPAARGRSVSALLVQALFEHGAAGVYATSRTLNTAMHRTLSRANFKVSGRPYFSAEHPGEEIALFLRPV
ncbi:GNAT family N-acetyltransferase [Rhodovulum marinum]|uniref:GNAT family N-acetyltransferase n=1 Tax=Rhodovulum marinum TaxID=320662 RepID=UPI00104FA44A|nr:GNAT family N-acetyltransferase [Rhodovulum marinum]